MILSKEINDKELEDRITNILMKVKDLTRLLDEHDLDRMAKKLGKLKKIINTYKFIKRKLEK